MAFLCEFLLPANPSGEQLRHLGAAIARLLLEVRLRKRPRYSHWGLGRHRPLRKKMLPMTVKRLLLGKKPKPPIVLGFDMRDSPWPKQPLHRDADDHTKRRHFQMMLSPPPPVDRDEMVRIVAQFIPLDDIIIDRTSWRKSNLHDMRGDQSNE